MGTGNASLGIDFHRPGGEENARQNHAYSPNFERKARQNGAGERARSRGWVQAAYGTRNLREM